MSTSESLINQMENSKEIVKAHWEKETCGVRYGSNTDRKKFYEEIKNSRYRLEPYIKDFAGFEKSKNLKILEIGVGAGTDFSQWVLASEKYKPTGIDLTEAAIRYTKERLETLGVPDSRYFLQVADAEHLPFDNSQFDLVYSWGVLHCSPDTERCFREVFRVLKPGGTVKAMIYHSPSWTGIMLWLRYALLKGKITMSQKEISFQHLESPGTKLYTLDEAKELIKNAGFSDARFTLKLAPGDILNIKPSAKYQGMLYKIIWKIYPRRMIKLLGNRLGLFLLIEAKKKHQI